MKVTFKEGGAFDFHTIFEQIKERSYQAYTVARETGQNGVAGADLANVHLEQLPAYEAGKDVEDAEEPQILSPIPRRPTGNATTEAVVPPNNRPAPDEPPPGYEEAQVQAVGDVLEERLRREAQ